MAFIYVGVIWLNHHYVFDRLCKTDFVTNVMNLCVIGTAALIPFPTGVLADAFREGNLQDQRTAVLLYAGVGSLMSAAWLPLLWHLFQHSELAKPEMPQAALADELPRPVVGIAMYLIAALVGWFYNPALATLIFMLAIVYYAWSGLVIFSVGRR